MKASVVKNLPAFEKNILIVFMGTSIVNVFNLVYQLVIAHQLTPTQFAAFNSLLAIFLILSSPISTLQTAVAKYISEYKARQEEEKIHVLLNGVFKRIMLPALITLVIFLVSAAPISIKLKLDSLTSSYLLAFLLASCWFIPMLLGGIQGLQLFSWLSVTAVLTGLMKLLLTFLLLFMGFKSAGALGALLLANIFGIGISFYPLRKYILQEAVGTTVNFKEIFLYMLPVMASMFCFMALVSFDMVLVKYYFGPEESGVYSLAQMLGKIFLFLPGAISMVLLPLTSGLNAKKMDTRGPLKKSVIYTGLLCLAAALFYNLFPGIVLKILTGKALDASVTLGRFFSVSMSFFTLVWIFVSYFISIKDLRFLWFLLPLTFGQIIAICFWHPTLVHVSSILCVSSILLFTSLFVLAVKEKRVAV
jgi:O-antigen/teichoic acid export membrane protein